MILFAASGICVFFLLLHSLYFRPFRATLLILFFSFPALFYGDLYDFNVKTAVIPFGKGIPVVQIVGFFFAFYCALTLATHIVETRGEDGVRRAAYFPLLVWTVYITIFIGFAIEYANFVIKWWTWRPYMSVGKIMLVGVWGWRPLLTMPLLLQCFVRRDFKSKLSWLSLIRLLFIVPFVVILFIKNKNMPMIIFTCLALGVWMFITFMSKDFLPLAAAIIRHRKMRVVVPVCLLWFFVFLTWMIWVDRNPLLQILTMPLWPLLLLLGRIKSPLISLGDFQYEKPRPLFNRQ